MTTPTTQREADERALYEEHARQHNVQLTLDIDGKDYHYPLAKCGWSAWQARAAIDQSTRQAAPEASASEQQDRPALELANAALIAAQPRDITPKGWKRHIAAIDATNCALHKPMVATASTPAATDQPSAGSGQKSTEAES